MEEWNPRPMKNMPSNVIIDCATGKIVAVNLFGTALESKIQELVKNRK